MGRAVTTGRSMSACGGVGCGEEVHPSPRTETPRPSSSHVPVGGQTRVQIFRLALAEIPGTKETSTHSCCTRTTPPQTVCHRHALSFPKFLSCPRPRHEAEREEPPLPSSCLLSMQRERRDRTATRGLFALQNKRLRLFSVCVELTEANDEGVVVLRHDFSFEADVVLLVESHDALPRNALQGVADVRGLMTNQLNRPKCTCKRTKTKTKKICRKVSMPGALQGEAGAQTRPQLSRGTKPNPHQTPLGGAYRREEQQKKKESRSGDRVWGDRGSLPTTVVCRLERLV